MTVGVYNKKEEKAAEGSRRHSSDAVDSVVTA
jgi:hypothetical protein